MTATACRVNATTVRVAVTWSNLIVTGGEIFVNIAPLETGYAVSWNQKGRARHSEDITMLGTEIADLVQVNLYNATDPNNILFEYRVIGVGNNAEELLAC